VNLIPETFNTNNKHTGNFPTVVEGVEITHNLTFSHNLHQSVIFEHE
jgi:hypothetical protein